MRMKIGIAFVGLPGNQIGTAVVGVLGNRIGFAVVGVLGSRQSDPGGIYFVGEPGCSLLDGPSGHCGWRTSAEIVLGTGIVLETGIVGSVDGLG